MPAEPAASMAPSVSWPLTVRYHECDPQGVVFNATYYAWADMGSIAFWRAAIGGYARLHDHGVDTVVIASSGRFRASCTYDELLDCETGVTRVGRTSFELTTVIRRAGVELATLAVSYVFVGADALDEPREPPPALRSALGDQ